MIPLKVLFVEDDQVDQLAFQRFVEEHGLPITYLLAGSLSEAKCLVTQGKFDLIVADYSLGDGTALDLLPFAQGVPVILLTGVGDEEIAARAFTAGVSDYLVKDIGRNYLEQLPERMEKAVGQRLRSGEALPESEEKFRQLFTRMPSAVAIYDAVDDGEDFIFKDFNTAAEKVEGIKKDDLIGKRVTQVFPGVKDFGIFAVLQRVWRTGQPEFFPSAIYRDQRDPGTWRENWVYKLASGEIVAIYNDVTERKRAEEALREREERYRALFDRSFDLIFVHDFEGHFIDANDACLHLLGYEREDIPDLNFAMLLSEDQLSLALTILQEIRETGAQKNPAEFKLQHRNGSYVYVETKGSAILSKGAYVAIQSVARDITERKKTEEALKESEERYRRILDLSQEGIWVLDEQFRTTFVNSQISKWLGYPSEDIVGHPMEEFLFQEDIPDHQREMQQHKMKVDSQYEQRFQRKDGGAVWAIVSAKAISRDDRFQGSFAMLTDITERKQAEEKLALNFETQAAMNALLGLSLESRTINEFLARSLDLVLSLQWLVVESKGAIFLADNAGKTLHLHVHKGLPQNLCAICSTVPFGYCICGRAAAVRAIQFADRVDECHDTQYEGMSPHGHYCVPVLSGDSILGVINLYVKESHTRSPWEEDFLKAVANTLAGTLERRRAEESLVETHEKLVQSLDSTILVLASVAEMRDPYTAGHQQRVSELAQAIAQELGLPEEQVEGIRVAGLLHDLGKMQIPAEILSKPGKLTSVELMLIRTHSQSGYDILKSTVFPWPIAQFVLQHHERWDGSGYPAGLKGEEILLEARILAVADVVEAMSSHRPYRPAFEAHEALWEILQNKGTLYDVAVAEACQRVFEERRFRFQSQVG